MDRINATSKCLPFLYEKITSQEQQHMKKLDSLTYVHSHGIFPENVLLPVSEHIIPSDARHRTRFGDGNEDFVKLCNLSIKQLVNQPTPDSNSPLAIPSFVQPLTL